MAIDQSVPQGGKEIDRIATYVATVNFGNLDPQGSNRYITTGSTVTITDVKDGDIVLGVAIKNMSTNEYEVYGNVVGEGQVRLSAAYTGTLTDGVDAANSDVHITIAHLKQ